MVSFAAGLKDYLKETDARFPDYPPYGVFVPGGPYARPRPVRALDTLAVAEAESPDRYRQ